MEFRSFPSPVRGGAAGDFPITHVPTGEPMGKSPRTKAGPERERSAFARSNLPAKVHLQLGRH